MKTDLEMLTWWQIALALKAEAFLTELEAGVDGRLPKTAGNAQRRRKTARHEPYRRIPM